MGSLKKFKLIRENRRITLDLNEKTKINDSLESEIYNKRREINKLQSDIDDTKRENRNFQRIIDDKNGEISRIKSNLDSKSREIDSLNSKLEDKKKEIKSLNSTLDCYRNNRDDGSLDEHVICSYATSYSRRRSIIDIAKSSFRKYPMSIFNQLDVLRSRAGYIVSQLVDRYGSNYHCVITFCVDPNNWATSVYCKNDTKLYFKIGIYEIYVWQN